MFVWTILALLPLSVLPAPALESVGLHEPPTVATDHGANLSGAASAGAHACAPGKTGPGCAWTCDSGAGEACGYTEYRESDGRVTGFLGRRASLFRTRASEAASRFVAWVTSDPVALGLRSDLDADDLDVQLFDASEHGRLSLIRLQQRYRGLPILGPESVLVLSGRGEDIRFVNGSVVDGGIAYANADEQCQESIAAAALRYHAATDGVAADQIDLDELQLVAMPHSKRVVWAAKALKDGAYLGHFAVDAMPVKEGELPRLAYVDQGVRAGLADEVPLQVRSHDLTSLPYGPIADLPLVVNATIATGAPLTGSSVSGGVQLGSPRVFMRDLHGQTLADGLAMSTRTLAPNGDFISAAEPDLAAQRVYHLYQGFYDITDRYLSAPGDPSLKQWDSYRGASSSFAPGTYQPRVAVFMSSGEKCRSQPACAGAYEVLGTLPLDLFEFSHSAEESETFEYIGYTHFKNNHVGLNTVAHEFGHVTDTFLFPGTAASTACTMEVDCVAKCTEDTPDEAPALTEAVAQLLALLYWYETSHAIDAEDCDAVEWISSNGWKAETPGPCMADLGQIAFMVRDADCPVADDEFCDKPELPGVTEICCDIDADPECSLISSECAQQGGGTKSVPTGACSESPGYRANSTLEAYWQLLTGRVCTPNAPYMCTPMASLGDVPPSEAAARALFYALRVNSRSFRQLFDNLAAYYSCAYGPAAFEDVRTILCTHRIMDCDAPPPMLCGECGNGVIDTGEQCDLTAVPVTCEALGYDGGEPACSLTCEIDEDGCFHAGPTTGSGPTTGGPNDTAGEGTGGSSEPDASSASATTSAGHADPDGCGCRESEGTGQGCAFSLGLVGLAWRSRRRRNP